MSWRKMQNFWRKNIQLCHDAMMSRKQHSMCTKGVPMIVELWGSMQFKTLSMDFTPLDLIIIYKNGCQIKPTLMFVKFLLKTQFTGTGLLSISSLFWSIFWQSFKITCPSWQRHRTWYSQSLVRTLPVAPLWCDMGCCYRTVVVIKAAANLYL